MIQPALTELQRDGSGGGWGGSMPFSIKSSRKKNSGKFTKNALYPPRPPPNSESTADFYPAEDRLTTTHWRITNMKDQRPLETGGLMTMSKQTMIKQTYKPLAALKELYRETEQQQKKRAYDDKKLARKLARMSKGARS